MKQKKLEKFAQVVLREAQIQNGTKFDACEKKINEEVTKYETLARKTATEHVNKEIRKVLTENSKRLSNEHVKLLQDLNERRAQIEKNIFYNINERLEQFLSSDEYENWLLSLINENIKNYDDLNDITVFINKSDEHLLDTIKKSVQVKIDVAAEHFIGGIKIVSESKKTVLNSTILEGLNEAKESLQYLYV